MILKIIKIVIYQLIVESQPANPPLMYSASMCNLSKGGTAHRGRRLYNILRLVFINNTTKSGKRV